MTPHNFWGEKVFENEAKHAKFKMKRLRQVKSVKEVPPSLFALYEFCDLAYSPFPGLFYSPVARNRPLRSAHVGMLMRARYVFLQSDVSSPKIPGLTIICDSVTKVFEN